MPLPEGPRMATNAPAGTIEVDPAKDGVGAEGLVDTDDDDVGRTHLHDCLAALVGSRSKYRLSDIGRNAGDDDDRQGEGRRLAVGEVLLVGPELRRERLDVDRDQQQRRGQFGDRREEHQAERRREARADEFQRDAKEGGESTLAEGARHLLELDRGVGDRGAHAHQGEREEQDGVGEDQQRRALVPEAVQVTLREVAQCEGDDQTGHREHQVGGALEQVARASGRSAPRASPPAMPRWSRERRPTR